MRKPPRTRKPLALDTETLRVLRPDEIRIAGGLLVTKSWDLPYCVG